MNQLIFKMDIVKILWALCQYLLFQFESLIAEEAFYDLVGMVAGRYLTNLIRIDVLFQILIGAILILN